MATTNTSVVDPLNTTHETIFQQLEAHPWSTDQEYQCGLASILNLNSESHEPVLTAQQEGLILQVRCYYYSIKFNTPIDLAAYTAWRSTQLPSCVSSLPADLALLKRDQENSSDSVQRPPAHSTISKTDTNEHQELDVSATTPANGQPQYPASFAEIVRLITTGQPIPGIREIPGTVLMGQGTQPQKSQRRKPWERSAPAVAEIPQNATKQCIS